MVYVFPFFKAFDECAASLLFGIFGTYLTFSTLLTLGNSEKAHPVVYWLLGSDLGITIIYFYRFFYCVSHGQRLQA